MAYYLQVGDNGKGWGVWRIEGSKAERLGVSKDVRNAYFEANVGESIWDALRRGPSQWFPSSGLLPFHKLNLSPGEFFPRIARPIDQHPDDAPGYSPTARTERSIIEIARGQMTTLSRQLDRICQTVHPSEQNFAVYGHDIRNLLILACTEVEMHWRGILARNGFIKDRYSTNEYVKLLSAMKLDEYRVGFPPFPWLEPMAPFKGWMSQRPTESLPWYDAYNAVKHNRENEFSRAKLVHALEAVSACYIMLGAQFGGGELNRRSEFQAYFQFAAVPTWQPADVYVLPYGTSPEVWTPVNYSFAS